MTINEFPLRRAARVFLGLLVWLSAISSARAHDPFDLSSRMTIASDRIELTVTMGLDGVRLLLADAGFTQEEITTTARATGPDAIIVQPATLASRFFLLKGGEEALPATGVVSLSEGMEVIFTLTYPRPTAGVLEIRAVCYETIAGLRTGSLIVYDESMAQLGAALLSAGNAQLAVSLPVLQSEEKALVAATESIPAAESSGASVGHQATDAPERPRPAFSEYLKLGVEHILGGFDHLLFLAALVIGVRKPVAMLGIISCFTLGHSVTLALAAWDLVRISPRIVEPLIALSIIVVAVENLVRKEAATDRYWMAGGFGLIHGFGFASVLSATGLGQSGAAMAVPLFSFNLGVELGQLAVMAVVVPLLFALRRWPAFERRGATVLSVAVIAMSSYWMWERVVP
jgi:hypothetical protein